MNIEDECFVKMTSLCEVNSMKLYVDVYFCLGYLNSRVDLKSRIDLQIQCLK